MIVKPNPELDKFFMNEERNVSRRVEELSKQLQSIFKKELRRSETKISYETGFKFRYGVFSFPTAGYLNDKVGDLTVSFIVYYFRNANEYNEFLANQEVASTVGMKVDYMERDVEIVTTCRNGVLDKNTFSDLSHELTHVLQYSQGFKKNEDHYQRAVSMINSKDIVRQIIGRMMYYSFKHEQDAFTQQFYNTLKDGKIKVKTFEEALNKFYPYKDYAQVHEMFLNIPKEQRDYQIAKFGKRGNTSEKRLLHMFQYFKFKLFKVWTTFQYEQRNSIVNESYISRRAFDVLSQDGNLKVGFEYVE